MSKFNKIWTWTYPWVLLHIRSLNFRIGDKKIVTRKNAQLESGIHPEHNLNIANIEFEYHFGLNSLEEETLTLLKYIERRSSGSKNPVMKPHVNLHVRLCWPTDLATAILATRND